METQIYKATTLECHIFLTLHCKVGMDNGEIISMVQLQFSLNIGLVSPRMSIFITVSQICFYILFSLGINQGYVI